MKSIIERIILALAAIGAINWGLNELEYNIVSILLSSIPTIESVVYYVIAVCGIWALIKVFK